jgi:ATP-binding cassette, subfamily C (CFTR/MRP), member 1
MNPMQVPQNVAVSDHLSEQQHPEETHRNFVLDRILVKWINPLIQLAYQDPLEESDVWPVDDTEMSVQRHALLFSAAWATERTRAREQGDSPSMRHTLARVYRRDLVLGGVYQLHFLVLQLLQPFIIGRLLHYISAGSEDSSSSGVATGLMWALLLGLVAFLSSNALILAFSNNRRFGTFVRAGLMMNIYEHSMHITNASRMKNDIGTTTNLMAIDSEKIFLAVQFVHFLW